MLFTVSTYWSSPTCTPGSTGTSAPRCGTSSAGVLPAMCFSFLAYYPLSISKPKSFVNPLYQTLTHWG